MSTLILFANILTFAAFIIHTFVGDRELKINVPVASETDFAKKTEKWIMARCGWHWVSYDLLLASIGLALINFTNYFDNEKSILKLLALYFWGYTAVWIITVCASQNIPGKYLKLGQWILLLTIACFIQAGSAHLSFK